MNDIDQIYREVVDTFSEPENFPRHEVSEQAERFLKLIDTALADRAVPTAEPDAPPSLHMASVMSGGDPDWLDMALDSVHPRAWIGMLRPPYDDEDGWQARIVHPYESGDTPPESGHAWEGTGPTRKAAILDAIAKAKGASRE